MSKAFIAYVYATSYTKKIAGIFDNYEAAKLCVDDSIYPLFGRIEEIDLSLICSTYVPSSQYSKQRTPSNATYYCFMDLIKDIPAHLTKDIDYEMIDLEERDSLDVPFYHLCFVSPKEDITEPMLIAGLVWYMDRDYKAMCAVRPKTPSALTALQLCMCFGRIVRTYGLVDRQILLDMAEDGEDIIIQSTDSTDYPEGDAMDLAERFWRQFVVDHSSVPNPSHDRWGSGC